MTGAEWIEFSLQASSNAITAFTVFLSMFSAYLIVAYAVGRKLSKFQVCIINVVYLLSSLITLSANSGNIRDSIIARQQAAKLVQEIPVGSDADPLVWAISIFSVNCLVVLASLIFMWQVRRGGRAKLDT